MTDNQNNQPGSAIELRRDYGDMHSQAVAFAASGFFGKDVQKASQAVTKILAGQELGLTPMASMTGIYLVEGKVQVGATMLAAVVQRSEHFDYRILNLTDSHCEIQFIVDGEPREPISSFTIEEAKAAGLAHKNNWKHYPRNMLFARAMSNGVKWHCPDLLGGMPIYTEGDESEEFQAKPAVMYNGPVDDLTDKPDIVVEAEVVAPAPETAEEVPQASQGQLATIAGILDTCKEQIDPEKWQMQMTAAGVVDEGDMTEAQADQLIDWLQAQVGSEVPA